jgi:hypothetical protein
MLVNISKASQLAGISRTNLYKNYIRKGKLTVSHDERNRPMVDTSELLRVFGKLQENSVAQPTQNTEDNTQKHRTDILLTPPETAKIQQLEQENQHLKERLAELQQLHQETKQEAKEREAWQRGQIEKLTDTIKLLEVPKEQKKSTYWWKFGV